MNQFFARQLPAPRLPSLAPRLPSLAPRLPSMDPRILSLMKKSPAILQECWVCQLPIPCHSEYTKVTQMGGE